MAITGDPLKIIRDLLYDNWTATNPSKATIGDTGFVVAPRRVRMSGLAVTVRRERRRDVVMATGANAPTLTYDTLAIGAWTLDKAQKDNMLKEIRRIIRAARPSPPGGILDIIDIGTQPRDDLSQREPILAEEVRVLLTYQE